MKRSAMLLSVVTFVAVLLNYLAFTDTIYRIEVALIQEPSDGFHFVSMARLCVALLDYGLLGLASLWVVVRVIRNAWYAGRKAEL